MKSFRHFVATALFFGKNAVKENKDQFSQFGKRAYIVTDEFLDGCRNYALEDVTEVLNELGIAYAVNASTEDNPPVESCVAIAREARAFQPDFVIGIGGGSALDTAKTVDYLITQPEDADPYDILFSGAPFYSHLYQELSLPLIGIPTTAGTGSEVTGGAVLTRNDIDNKDTARHKFYCTVAFLDARYIRESPSFLIHTGVMDALAHGVETYINIKSNPMNRAIAAVGMNMFAEFKDSMLNDTLSDEDYEKMLLTANIMGQAFMQAGTCIPHGMGYPLSHYKGINHGLSCSVTLGCAASRISRWSSRSSICAALQTPTRWPTMSTPSSPATFSSRSRTTRSGPGPCSSARTPTSSRATPSRSRWRTSSGSTSARSKNTSSTDAAHALSRESSRTKSEKGLLPAICRQQALLRSLL